MFAKGKVNLFCGRYPMSNKMIINKWKVNIYILLRTHLEVVGEFIFLSQSWNVSGIYVDQENWIQMKSKSSWSCWLTVVFRRTALKVWRESGDWGLAQAKRGETHTSDSDMDTRKGYVWKFILSWAFLWLKRVIDMQPGHFANESNGPMLLFFPVIKYWSLNNEPLVLLSNPVDLTNVSTILLL